MLLPVVSRCPALAPLLLRLVMLAAPVVEGADAVEESLESPRKDAFVIVRMGLEVREER